MSCAAVLVRLSGGRVISDGGGHWKYCAADPGGFLQEIGRASNRTRLLEIIHQDRGDLCRADLAALRNFPETIDAQCARLHRAAALRHARLADVTAVDPITGRRGEV